MPRAVAYLGAVSIERPWKPDAVLMLCAGLMISLSLGTFASIALKAAMSDLPDAQQKFASFLLSTASFQLVGLILTHYFLKVHEFTWGEFLGLSDRKPGRAIRIAVAVTVIALPLTLGLNSLSEFVLTKLQGKAAIQPTMQILAGTDNFTQRVIFGFAAILLAPLIEEILFRGILYRTGQQMGYPRLALYGTSFVFAAIHGSLMTMLPLTVLAIILAKLYDHTNRLIAPILAHSLFNAVNFFAYLNRDELMRWFESLQ